MAKTKKSFLLLLLLMKGICSFGQASQKDFSLSAPDQLNGLEKISLWATYYYIHSFESGGSVPILYQNEKPTGFFADTCNFCKAALEGTVYIKDSTVLSLFLISPNEVKKQL